MLSLFSFELDTLIIYSNYVVTWYECDKTSHGVN